jgi:hypothetical protein
VCISGGKETSRELGWTPPPRNGPDAESVLHEDVVGVLELGCGGRHLAGCADELQHRSGWVASRI